MLNAVERLADDYPYACENVRKELSSANQPTEGVPNAAELAEQIKELRAANAVEATPERTAKRQVSAEEPVTKKILSRPKVEIEVQHVNGEVGRSMVDRIKRAAEWAT